LLARGFILGTLLDVLTKNEIGGVLARRWLRLNC
jgi:hypothetical protein